MQVIKVDIQDFKIVRLFYFDNNRRDANNALESNLKSKFLKL